MRHEDIKKGEEILMCNRSIRSINDAVGLGMGNYEIKGTESTTYAELIISDSLMTMISEMSKSFRKHDYEAALIRLAERKFDLVRYRIYSRSSAADYLQLTCGTWLSMYITN